MKILSCVRTFQAVTLVAIMGSCAVEKGLPDPQTSLSWTVSRAALEGWDSGGFQNGDRIPDFTLYTQGGKRFTLSEALSDGKPLVLINASYTCDVSRRNLPDISLVARQFRKKANFYMVYTIEAHPDNSVSPYSREGDIWITERNVHDHIEAHQPQTYRQRQLLSMKWKRHMMVSLPVLLDTPDNFYWNTFGQAPNMAYVILPDRTVYYRQTWFNASGLNRRLATLFQLMHRKEPALESKPKERGIRNSDPNVGHLNGSHIPEPAEKMTP